MGKFVQPDSTDRSKVLSVRLSNDEFERLTAMAHDAGVGASTLARNLIRKGLALPRTDFTFSDPRPAPMTLAGPSTTLNDTARTASAQQSALEARLAALEHWVAQQQSRG